VDVDVDEEAPAGEEVRGSGVEGDVATVGTYGGRRESWAGVVGFGAVGRDAHTLRDAGRMGKCDQWGKEADGRECNKHWPCEAVGDGARRS